ncbi:hypothetical protein K431DRAFT_315026 [Polychaeton citri CBS 116435]|uniref:Uncharacterized protein n=1 Tax=Polychaeton citri CBS 116435 TaxID=1314669 RepID=A0A9P4Q2W0_9PEZI|nr:hypothetical protein K431DRAFT_315026 [Polychaeton citri CBS 116435]
MVKWSAAEDQQLLLVANVIHKFDCNKIAELWNENYAGENGANKVTGSAISQHLMKLRSKVAGPSAQSTPRKIATPALKSKTTTTPSTGGAKRKRNIDEQDDSEEDAAGTTPTIKRESLGRTKKTPRKYCDFESDDGEEDEAVGDEFDMFDVPYPFKNKKAAKNSFIERFKKDKDFGGSIEDGSDISPYDPTNDTIVLS